MLSRFCLHGLQLCHVYRIGVILAGGYACNDLITCMDTILFDCHITGFQSVFINRYLIANGNFFSFYTLESCERIIQFYRVFFTAFVISSFVYRHILPCHNGRMLSRFRLHGLQLRHVHRIGVFRAGGYACNLTGDSQIRIAYRNGPVDGLPCIYISVYQF